MENNNIAGRLRMAAETVESWQCGEVPEIEKDSVLASLRDIYTTIKYCGSSEPACVCDSVKEASDVTGYMETAPAPEPITPAEPSAVAAAAAFVPEVPEVEPIPAEETYPVEISEVPSPPQAPCAEPSYIVNSEDEKEEIRENILFDENEVPARPKLDRRAILSLYGEDGNEPAVNTVPVRSEPEIKPAAAAYEPEAAAPQASLQDTEPVQVLGDVFSNGGQTVSDMYSGHAEKPDVASVVGSGKVDSLRGAVGINDKFLLIRNLFDGDSQAYENVMATLDGFGSLDDALIYIHENFNWNPDNEAVKMLIDLLTRKLS